MVTISRVMVYISFLLVTGAVLVSMPTELFGVDSQQLGVEMPREFEALGYDVGSEDISVEETLIRNGVLDFNMSVVSRFERLYRVAWGIPYVLPSGGIQVRHERLEFHQSVNMYPIVNRDRLVGAWVPDDNMSIFQFTGSNEVLLGYFEDTNTTRSDIGLAWDAGQLNCTLVYLSEYQEDEDKIGARRILEALLTFRLPSVFDDIHWLLATSLSIVFYVPIVVVMYWVVNTFWHGGVG